MTAENTIPVPEENGIQLVFEKHIRKERRKKSRLRLCVDIILTAAVVFVLFSVISGIAVIQGDSMQPNLTNGSLALFYRLDHAYQRNDIVLFKSPIGNELLIKRIVAIAGDKVDIDDKTGELLINGKVQQENTAIGKTYARTGGPALPLTVPRDSVFVMGDNREVALDSRSIGTIKNEILLGKVIFEIKRLDA